jgi:hypothetical protein
VIAPRLLRKFATRLFNDRSVARKATRFSPAATPTPSLSLSLLLIIAIDRRLREASANLRSRWNGCGRRWANNRQPPLARYDFSAMNRRWTKVQ